MELLKELYLQHFGKEAETVVPLPQSGSNRQYVRLANGPNTAIGVLGNNDKENNAFVYCSEHFKAQGLPVPELYVSDLANQVYLQEDLGDQSLYGLIHQLRPTPQGNFPKELVAIYQKCIDKLIDLQVDGASGFDFGQCYPRSAFDKQSMMWDLNYFKYYFAKLANIEFDEQALEDDFHRFADYLLSIPTQYFMHRDFQSRNIMLKEEEVFFIDYQGGRKGPLQYDLASLLFQAKANIPYDIRAELLNYYHEQLSHKGIEIETQNFKDNYYGIVYIRTMQVLGAYGFRGLYERKAHFIQSIPYALNNLEWLLQNVQLSQQFSELEKVWQQAIALEQFRKPAFVEQDKLTVRISSFSYRRGIPQDPSGNGGGFVFDCRNIHNPGRFAPYKKLTGRDESVKKFLQEESHIDVFLEAVFALVDKAVQTYIDRGFKHLMVSFGCTGGQHRSVYSADHLNAHLQNKFDIYTELQHIEQELKNWEN